MLYSPVVFVCVRLCSFLFPFLSVVWLYSVARPCATRDESSKDNVCKPTIPAGINHPPPSETISHATRVPDYKNTLSGTKGLLSVSDEGPCGKVSFYIRWRSVGRRIRKTAEGEESPLGGQLE